jgi:hypothetical protein
MIHRVDVVFVTAHRDQVPVTAASDWASLWEGSSDPAAEVAVVEGQARPSSHILYLVAVAGSLLGPRCKVGELASPVVPSQEVEEVALTAVPPNAEEPAVAPVASSLVSLVSVLDSRACIRACIRVCHRMNASDPENAFSDFVNHDHGGGGAFDIPLPRE